MNERQCEAFRGRHPGDDEALEALAAKWAEWYDIWQYASGIRWQRKDGYGGVQYAPTPDQADRDIGADYALRPAWLHPRTVTS